MTTESAESAESEAAEGASDYVVVWLVPRAVRLRLYSHNSFGRIAAMASKTITVVEAMDHFEQLDHDCQDRLIIDWKVCLISAERDHAFIGSLRCIVNSRVELPSGDIMHPTAMHRIMESKPQGGGYVMTVTITDVQTRCVVDEQVVDVVMPAAPLFGLFFQCEGRGVRHVFMYHDSRLSLVCTAFDWSQWPATTALWTMIRTDLPARKTAVTQRLIQLRTVETVAEQDRYALEMKNPYVNAWTTTLQARNHARELERIHDRIEHLERYISMLARTIASDAEWNETQ